MGAGVDRSFFLIVPPCFFPRAVFSRSGPVAARFAWELAKFGHFFLV